MKDKLLRRRRKSPIRQKLTITRLLPNIVTIAGLCSGLTAVRFALEEKWELAIIAIMLAGVFDALDGRVARFFGQSSHFGGELDSLADAISFGVAPALVLYLRALQNLGSVGWVVALGFVVCMALRLARFNTLSFFSQDAAPEPWEKKYFTGVPAPAAAILLLMPIYVATVIGPDFRFPVPVVTIYVVFIGFLTVSRVPTYSMKGHAVQPKAVLPLLLGGGLCMASLMTAPWITLSVICILYLGSLPFSARAYGQAKKHPPTPIVQPEPQKELS